MSVEAITDAIHEYLYEKLNDSPETEGENKIRYVKKNEKRKLQRNNQKDRQTSRKLTATVAEHRTGHVNTNVPLEERNAQNVTKLAISPNVAAQTEK